MPPRYDSVRGVFEEAQRGFQNHNELLVNMKKLHEKTTEDEFEQTFLWHLKRAMVVFNREPAVERIMDFVAKYATIKSHCRPQPQKALTGSDEEDDDSISIFLEFILTFLLDVHDAQEKAVRFRVCQLINKILNNMGDDAVIDDDLAEKIFKSMLMRLHDKFPAVRTQAAAAISRLQDPSDPDCPVIATYLKLMASDSSADVRRAVLLNIGLSSQTLEMVLERTQDIAESVRKLAYRILAEKVNIKSLTIAQRVQLLSNGLNDRSESVREVSANDLLGGWLKSFDGDVVKLLKCLDVEGCATVAELVVKTILKGLPKADLQLHIKSLTGDQRTVDRPVRIGYENLDAETSLYWRCLGEHLRSQGVDGEELLDELLPEMSGFCDYIQGYVDSHLRETSAEQELQSQQIFITQQLLILMGVMDLSDEVGRKRFSQMIHDLLVLPEIPQLLVEVLHARYLAVQPDVTSRIQELVEVIADVRQPIVVIESAQNKQDKRQWELKLAGISVKLNQFRGEMEQCVAGQEFTRAAELKEQILELEEEKEHLASEESSFSQTIREEKDDPETLLKCLTIASEMLQGVTSSDLNPTLTTLVQTLILPGVQNEDPLVRNMAVKCLGLCALLSCDFARTHLVLFLQVAQLDQELVRVTALKVVFDLLQTFGLHAFKLTAVPEPGSEDVSTSRSRQVEEGEEAAVEENEEAADKTPEDAEEESQPTDTAASVLSILTEMLESESNDLRDVAAEGLAKLLLSGRVLSAKLFSRLLLLWYNPTTEEDNNLRHCLGVFFPVFAFASRTNQELVEEAFIPTLETLFSAPVSSPLASVNINNVAELLVALTNSKNLERNGNTSSTTEVTSIHSSLSLAVANVILSDPEAPGVRVLCKVLTMMDLAGCAQSTVKEMKVLTSRMLAEISDKLSVKSLNKFSSTLRLLSDAGDNDTVDASPTEPEGDVRLNTKETQDENAHESQTTNEENSQSKNTLQVKAHDSQASTEAATIMKTPAQRKQSTKPKSKTKSCRRGKKTNTVSPQLSPSSLFGEETPARQTRRTRKSKSDAAEKFQSMLVIEDESSGKENMPSSDTDDLFES